MQNSINFQASISLPRFCTCLPPSNCSSPFVGDSRSVLLLQSQCFTLLLGFPLGFDFTSLLLVSLPSSTSKSPGSSPSLSLSFCSLGFSLPAFLCLCLSPSASSSFLSFAGRLCSCCRPWPAGLFFLLLCPSSWSSRLLVAGLSSDSGSSLSSRSSSPSTGRLPLEGFFLFLLTGRSSLFRASSSSLPSA